MKCSVNCAEYEGFEKTGFLGGGKKKAGKKEGRKKKRRGTSD